MTIYTMRNGPKVLRSAFYEDITHFEADNKYTTAYTDGSDLILDEPLVELVRHHSDLVYVHRSVLVKRDLIESLRVAGGNHKYIATLKSGIELKVSRRQYPKIRDILLDRARSAE